MVVNLANRRRLGVLVWITGAVVALLWSTGSTQVREGRGLGYAAHLEVSAVEAGRLAELSVEIHQEVHAGDVVARLDPLPLLQEREVLAAELLAVEDQESARAANEARRFAQGLEDVALDRASLRVSLEEDRTHLAGLLQRLDTERGLQATGASSRFTVEDLEREASTLAARIQAEDEALATADAAWTAARGRQQAAPSSNDWALVAATRRLEQLDGRLERLELTTGIDGQVTWIYHHPGEVVQPGEPILRVSHVDTADVLAWIPAATVGGLLPGGDATVIRASGESLMGSVMSVGASPMQIPEELWRNPAGPEWGVPVRIRLADGRVAPDEPVQVRI